MIKTNETNYQSFSKFNLNNSNKSSNKLITVKSAQNELIAKSAYIAPNLNLVAFKNTNSLSPKFNKSVYASSPSNNLFNNTNTQFSIMKKSQTASKNFKFSHSGIEIQNINMKYRLYDKAKHSSSVNMGNANKFIKSFSYNSYKGTVRYIF